MLAVLDQDLLTNAEQISRLFLYRHMRVVVAITSIRIIAAMASNFPSFYNRRDCSNVVASSRCCNKTTGLYPSAAQ